MITAGDVYEAALELAGRLGLDEAEVLELTGVTTGASVDEQIDAIRELYAEHETGELPLAAPDAGQCVIIPSDGSGYVELGGTAGHVARFRKHAVTINQPFAHPKSGELITLGEDAWQQMKSNFDRKASMCAVVLADANNAHSEDPMRSAGEVVGLERDGNKVYTVLEIRRPDIADAIRQKLIMGSSAFLSLNYKGMDGKPSGPAILHQCLTNRPALTDLGPFEEIIAATAASGDVVMLTAAAPPAIRFARPPSPARRSTVTRSAAPSIDVDQDDVDAAVLRFTRTLYPESSELEIARSCTDTKGALAELCAERGMGHSPYEQGLAFGMLADRLTTRNPEAGEVLRMTLAEDGDVLGLAAGDYAIPAGMVGPKSFLPTDTPDRLLRSWEQLHTHWRKRLSADDFSSARDACIEAADDLGIVLNDGLEAMDPDGTPDVAATYGLPSSAEADEVDRYLALSASTVPALEGITVPARSVTSAADLRLAGSPELPDDAYAVIGRHPEHFTPSARPGSAAAARKHRRGPDLEHDVTTPSQDDLTRANPSKGGQMHPEVARIVAGNPELFNKESPRSGNRTIKPRTQAQRARERAMSRPGHT